MTPLAENYTGESPDELWREFQDEEYRYAYAEDFLNTSIATQIVTLREQRGLSQTKFGELIGTKQPGVSRLENVNHSTWETATLKRIARKLGVRLKISFETFSTLIEEDKKFSRQSLMRPKFEDDPGLIERKGPASETTVTTAGLITQLSMILPAEMEIRYATRSIAKVVEISKVATPKTANGSIGTGLIAAQVMRRDGSGSVVRI